MKIQSLHYSAAVATIGLASVVALGGPINSDVAFTPREGGGILRLQYTFTESEGRGAVQHVSTSVARTVLVYGATPKLALFFSVPYINRKVDRFDRRLGRVEDTDAGFGDVTLMAKYRFSQKDLGPGSTVRWAALAGLNIRSGDSDFSSDSYDPILGAVFTWRGGRNRFDADLVYQFNTGGGKQRHDSLRYDLAFSYRVFPAVYAADQPYEIDAVAELNGRYLTDGSNSVYLSPGIQILMERWSFELSVQLPVVQDLAGAGAEPDYHVVLGVRYRW